LTSGSALSPAEAKAFYDRFGARQDGQGFYEDAAIDPLIRAADFASAHRVFELGFGTGKLAHRLLCRELPQDATYAGVDVSSTMLSLARERLARFGSRVELVSTDGSMSFDYPDASFDRFVTTYVLDLLPEREIDHALAEAHRLLRPSGRLCVAGLTKGERLPSSLVSRLWAWVQAGHPAWVGGCRPVRIVELVPGRGFRVLHGEVVTSWAIPSEVLIAEAI
jgi:ubiquinone/menaquinone biosynthesis C-methylase UbiE